MIWEYAGAPFPEALHEGYKMRLKFLAADALTKRDILELLGCPGLDPVIWKRIGEKGDRKNGDIDPIIRRAVEVAFSTHTIKTTG